jgi:EAL domain-containing protein (putative c-di-GMP-specific phosphodiesterase class I)
MTLELDIHHWPILKVENGCENIQGYFYSRPIPTNEMEAYLKI